jgi:hypothetical protein
MKDTLLNTHGRRTYRMAWVVEIGLCCLAVAIAIFNVITAWERGNIMNAVLLGAGWLILAVVELSTIPLAGSLRIARWEDKWIACIGVVGLTFLSAWTVYEFNEFASYNMTKPARMALITVDSKNAEIVNLKAANNSLLVNNKEANEKLQSIKEEKTETLEKLRSEREGEINRISDEKKRELSEIEEQVNELNSAVPMNTVQNAKTRKNEKEIERLEAEMAVKTKDVSIRMDDAKVNEVEATASSKGSINEQRTQIAESIKQLRQQKMEELSKLTKGFMLESKKRKLRGHYDNMIKQEQDRLVALNAEDRQNSVAFDSSMFDAEVAAIKTEYTQQVSLIREENANIYNAALNESKSLVEKRNKEAEQLQAKATAVGGGYRDTLNSTKEEFSERKDKITKDYDKKISEFGQATKTDAAVQKERSDNEAKIAALTAEINKTIQEVEHEMEPILYYRIAKWFHAEEGLPAKEAYLKAQTHIFAPMGLFFGIVSIALAYIGTGLKRDAELPNQPKNNKQKTKQLNWYNKRVSELEAKSEKQKLEIIKSKQEIFDVAKAIPQKIVLKDEVRDLASYQLYNTIDFTTDELERYGNYQVVNA